MPPHSITDTLDSGPTPALASAAGASDILVVDDNPNNLLAVEVALGELSGSLVTARSGEDALRALLRQDFALILLDVQMPGMDGFEAARLIRSRGRSRHTPIIFITAYNQDDADILRGYELGAVDFLFKPIVPEVLRTKVSVFVELRRRAAELAHQAELLREHERREHERQLIAEREHWEGELLRRENRELEDNDRRKNEFLAMLAHELRTPLSPVVMGLDLLRPLAVDDEGRAVIVAMERQVHHLTRLVDDLLEVSRITRGSIELRRHPSVVQDAVHQAVAMCQPDLDRRGHHLTLEIADEPLWIDADPVRIAQVVCNLLTNAVRYTEPGGHIKIACAPAGDQIAIVVSDNGRGIAPEFLDRVFDIFVRGEGSGGLGLGLALVRRLVEMHGGTVAAHSDGLGAGSRFEVTLQRVGAATDPTRELAANTDSAPAKRVVIVEDHDDIRYLLAEALRRRGHEVVTANRGEDGVATIASERPDIALVDIGLPDIDGVEVARRVRSALGDAIRLVAMTGFGQAAVKQRALAAGFDEFLVKPIQVATIERLLGNAERRGVGAPGASTGASTNASTGASIGASLITSPRTPAPAPAPTAQAPTVVNAGGTRVLIVEDDEDASGVLSSALARDGHQVEVAHDGAQAMRHALAWQPRIVLCDLSLPGEMSGLDIARAMRSDERTRHARLVAVTGHSRPEDRRAATEAGFDDYLVKPLTLAAVKAAVARGIAETGSSMATAPSAAASSAAASSAAASSAAASNGTSPLAGQGATSGDH